MSAPKLTPAEVDAILCKPGALHELETRVIDGRVQRVYKNLYPSLRIFWLWSTNQYPDKTYVVFENQRYTFRQMLEMSMKWASVFRDVYNVGKGDRVAICARNYPEYMIAFWACHLLGGVSVLINSMLSIEPMAHCLKKSDCKLILVDSSRADMLESIASRIGGRFSVIVAHEGKGNWGGMDVLKSVLENHRGDPRTVLADDPKVLPEDDATILFTSGTTGLPKGVLSTQRMFLTTLGNHTIFAFREAIRLGESAPEEGPQQGVLLPTPCFHVTGSSLMQMAPLSGAKLILMRKWDIQEAIKLIKAENIKTVVGVPSLAYDLAQSPLAGYPLETIGYGGAPTHVSLVEKTNKAFPTASMSQAYGLTETNATVVGAKGDEYLQHPQSVGKVLLVNDVIIMDPTTNVQMPIGQVGEVWIRGPNVMKGYWRDPEATAKAITKDGWFKSGDLGYFDAEGFLYISDRAKDIIIRGGENVDSVSVENACYAAEPEVLEAAAVGVPDDRLGELVTVLITLKPTTPKGKVSEASLMNLVSKLLPRFAIPVMIHIYDKPFNHTPSGKIVKTDLKKIALREWNRRSSRPKL